MNICILSTPRSGTEYFKRMLSETCSMPIAISDPFHPVKILKTNSDYIDGAREQLDIIKNLVLTNSIIIKENHFFIDFDYQMKIWATEIGIDLSENAELKEIFNQYTNLIKDNFYIIKLIRNDVFETALSLYIADYTNVWHRFEDDPVTNIDKILVEVEYFKYLLSRCILMKKSLVNYTNFNEHIFYENLIGNYSEDCKLITGFNIDATHYSKSQRLLNKNIDKKNIIENYEEILNIYESEISNVY